MTINRVLAGIYCLVLVIVCGVGVYADTAVYGVSSGGGAVDSVFGRTGAVTAQSNDYTWAQINKATSSIADIATRSHTSLADIGANNHTQIDTFIASKASASGLASLDSNSRVVQDPASVKGGSIQRVIYKNTTQASHTGNTSETSVRSWSMPGGTVADGDIIRITSYLTYDNNSNNKTFKVKFGSKTYTDITYTTTGAARYQTDIIVHASDQLTVQSLANSNGGWSTSASNNTSTEDITSAILFDFTWTLANGSDTARLEAVTIEVL